ncbi:MAG: MmcQ/YjbR family DNA-binding protein [Ruminococcus sp.]|nr:MmcQ/YjbR family DNA-binding protein [Ruminococcus sp.]
MENSTQKQRITNYLQDIYGTEAEHLWTKFPNYSVFRHPLSKKWYGIIMDIKKDKLGLDGDEPIDIFVIKCSPIMIGSLLNEKGFLPAYHMNKENWITILLNETVSDDEILSLVELSFESVAPKYKKKKKN